MWSGLAIRALLVGAAYGPGPAPPEPLSLEAAISFALAHQPAVREAVESQTAAEAEVSVRRTAYLPSLDLFGEEDVAGLQPVSGLLFPLPGLPASSGAPEAAAFAPGSALGGSADWNADLFHRMALVDVALAEQARAEQATLGERLAVASNAGEAYLRLAEAEERVRAERVNVSRAQAFQGVVDVLVRQELRPAADASRAAAILSLARVALAQGVELAARERARLAVALGAPGAPLQLSLGGLVSPPAPAREPSAPSPRNPYLLERSEAVVVRDRTRRAIGLEYLPRLDVVLALWGHGSAFPPSPTPGGGLVPNSPSFAAGLVLSWPALSLFEIRARSRQAAALTERSRASQQRVAQAVAGQIDEARARLEGSLAVAAETPIALSAARVTEAQALARYQAGLVTVVEVAEAERILAQAEVEDSVARLEIHRAHLLLARAVGDLSPFLAEAHAAQGAQP
ncbi:MAG: TolC family protein [Myxococcales bacterium]